ncbi:glycosyltransferase [Aerococcaceae bacterium zg-ZUI334]|uniref:glycosyltransferase n=1 Tax=Aerococcaceae bacterium zg-252 TaxID=2796928 RepID=UPI001B938746|nr:glycosyltransferase [Aerococcaceae bacterium zg-ZUI334]
MNILHINSYYSTSGLFKHLYERQVEEQYDIQVYVPISHQYPSDRIAATGEYTLVSRNHHHFDRYVFHLKHHRILKDLKQQYDSQAFDLVHAHSLFSNGWLAYQFTKKTDIPYVVAVRSTDIRTFFDKMPWLKAMGLKILKHAAKIIFISQNNFNEVFDHHIPNFMKDELLAKSQVIRNGIDAFWLDNRYENRPVGFHHPIRMVSVGKAIPEKRFVQLADMVKSYNDNIHPIELHVVGPAWNPKIVEQLNNHPVVHYHGPKSKEALLDFYRQMDIFALLSSPETFGLVYPEAMSQGLPVIYSKNEGFDSFFQNHQIGVSVDKNDELAFIKAIDYILNHYDTLSQQALVGATQFNWDSIHQEYKVLYDQIMNNGKELNE